MNAHLLTAGESTTDSAVSSKVSRRRLLERAVERAALDGRAPQDAGKSDWETAKHDLCGEPELEPEPKTVRDHDEPDESHASV